jgi:hypothetical protein
MGTEPESVYAQKGTIKDVLARYLKKTEAQVCTLFDICALLQRDVLDPDTSVLARKLTFKMYAVHCTYMYTPPPITVNYCLFFHIQVLSVSGVYFLQVKNKL